ncbi:MAG TPA: hypothetical protein VND83_07320 [Acidimicrobiales bacterium]|nr:hypothetical protein [Acidimicrobiales bacterium]
MRQGWSRGTRPWFAVGVASATAVVYALAENHSIRSFLWRAGGVSAALPLKVELARLPLSLLLATPYLPVWAACAQILAVFGIGEFVIGRRLTVVLVVLGHFGATLVARVVLDAIHTSVFGLTPALAHVLDTGPSAATTAVGAGLLIVARMNRSAVLLAAALVAAYLIAPGVDGVEHLVALACGLGVGVICRLAASRLSSRSFPPWLRAARDSPLTRRLPTP